MRTEQVQTLRIFATQSQFSLANGCRHHEVSWAQRMYPDSVPASHYKDQPAVAGGILDSSSLATIFAILETRCTYLSGAGKILIATPHAVLDALRPSIAAEWYRLTNAGPATHSTAAC
jgi:hypothetical protein